MTVELLGTFTVGGLILLRFEGGHNSGVADRIVSAVNENTDGVRDHA